MSWLVSATYRPGGAQARLAIRDRHLEYLLARAAQLRFGGALLDDGDPPTVTGMFVAIEAGSRDDVQRFVDDEPYRRAGLFDTVTIVRLQQFVPHADPDFLVNELRRERARLAAGG